MNNNVSATTAGYAIAAMVAIIANTLLTWAKESYPPLFAVMKSLGHHWAIHGTVIVLIFLVLGYIFSRSSFTRRMSGTTLAVLLFFATTLAGAGLVGFFLFK